MTTPKAQIGVAIQRGIAQLAAHPSVFQVLEENPPPSKSQSVDVIVAIQVGLPNQWMAQGHSPNGVRSIETVTFAFPAKYPTHAPKVTLRDDFDRSLAHIQPGDPQAPIEPCLIMGDANELLHEQGLSAIVNQLVIWLENAAMGKLIDPQQGWEPIRRDSLENIIIADDDFLRSLVTQKRQYELIGFTYLRYGTGKSDKPLALSHWYYGQVSFGSLSAQERRDIFSIEPINSHLIRGSSLTLVVFPGVEAGEQPIIDRYLPEDVTDIASLKARAKLYQCDKNLQAALAKLEVNIRDRDFRGNRLPVAIILCVRRPFPLIGETSDIELIPYIMEVGTPAMLPEGDRTVVSPACHQSTISQKLLQRFSGDQLPAQRNIALVGCGSLGSKIGVHLARAGAAPTIVVDKGWLSPHNAARHALLPHHEYWSRSKAKALSWAIRGLAQKADAYDQDVTTIVNDRKRLKKVFPSETWAIVNATASLVVRAAFAATPHYQLHPRIIETSLFADSEIGLLTVEGPGRNPNCADLITEAYAIMREHDALSRIVFTDDSPIRPRSIGQGCSSATMIIPDAKISLMAASMTLAITQMRESDLPDSGGKILLGSMQPDGLGVTWQSTMVPPVHIVEIAQAKPWKVRILDRAHQKILKICAESPAIETGGILVGRIFESLNAFIVTDVLPAPADSHRSSSKFTLGTSGVSELLEQYTRSCNHTLYCFGTWHSHVSDAGPSALDWQTARQISNDPAHPLVLLIRTPNHYHAISSINTPN
jgi:Prokaryotic E2 family A